jgi:hypothetical protein
MGGLDTLPLPIFKYNSIYYKDCTNMKLQDEHPYDSSIVGLNGIFHSVDIDSFYINSECILATNHIISTGKTYITVDNPTAKGIKMYDVTLLDVFYKEGVINMIVREMLSHKKFNIKYCIGCPEHQCTWMLIDLDYFIDKLNANAIKQYCGKCSDAKNKPVSEIKPIQSHDDLLEFDYS